MSQFDEALSSFLFTRNHELSIKYLKSYLKICSEDWWINMQQERKKHFVVFPSRRKLVVSQTFTVFQRKNILGPVSSHTSAWFP